MFISFDYEFSGLSTCKFDEKSILDSDEVRYAKLKQVVEKLYGFQLGICCFIPCASRDDLGAIDLVNNEKSENSN